MIKTIVSTALPVAERLLIRKNVISNGKGKGRFCIVTGTHGDELEGQMVCYEMARLVQKHIDQLDGTVEIYPALNPLGIDTIQRGVPNFDLDMNRIFPGNEHGTMVEQTAFAIYKDLKGADMVLDIHSSNLYLRESPQVRINVLNEEELVPYAKHLGVDFVWVHDAATVLEATLAHSLNSTGTRCLVVEMGVGQRINHRMCCHLVKGIFNLMKEMGIWNGETDLTDMETGELLEPIFCKGDRVAFLNAECSGVFLTEMRSGKIVDKGQSIGQIVNPLTGEILSDVKSPIDGFLFTIRAYPIVYEGSLMARIFQYNAEETEIVKAVSAAEQ
ncbi:MAG: succinylglutamate desuccinylase/aspartoacylase family protein [Prevotellaceae bacterium]|nr:succinylglutamate desuccinylase/aspartoacylase family protein [Candidatus Minthosoma caballi]